ncbi:MAG: TfoX/Sxy family DNA transformation protein [Magnetospirillum sp.]|nr:TfoX/Sxy family DNA transformation protein [Magnetospirillum sp.]
MSTPALPDFVEHCIELLGDLGAVAARRMFGGWGLYVQGCMFALIADEVLYLKVDAETRPRFEAEGLPPFTYEARGKRHAMSYFQPPESAMEDRAEMRPWARAAADAAFRAAAARKPPSAKASPRKAAGLLNLGPKTGAWLAEIGIHTPADLKRVGAVKAYVQIKRRMPDVSTILLYALHGALVGTRFDKLEAATKCELLEAAQIEAKQLEKRLNSPKKGVKAKH